MEHLRCMHDAFRPRVVHVSTDGIAKTFTGKLQRSQKTGRFATYSGYLGDFMMADDRPRAVPAG